MHVLWFQNTTSIQTRLKDINLVESGSMCKQQGSFSMVRVLYNALQFLLAEQNPVQYKLWQYTLHGKKKIIVSFTFPTCKNICNKYKKLLDEIAASSIHNITSHRNLTPLHGTQIVIWVLIGRKKSRNMCQNAFSLVYKGLEMRRSKRGIENRFLNEILPLTCVFVFK